MKMSFCPPLSSSSHSPPILRSPICQSPVATQAEGILRGKEEPSVPVVQDTWEHLSQLNLHT